MALLVATLLAIFILPAPWGIVAVVLGAAIELGESLFWIRFTRGWRAETGVEALVGQTAVVVDACRPDGWVRVHGERWRAHCADEAGVGDSVRIVAVNDLVVEVEGTRPSERT